jgi:hypothetical protein
MNYIELAKLDAIQMASVAPLVLVILESGAEGKSGVGTVATAARLVVQAQLFSCHAKPPLQQRTLPPPHPLPLPQTAQWLRH